MDDQWNCMYVKKTQIFAHRGYSKRTELASSCANISDKHARTDILPLRDVHHQILAALHKA
jgi:hypothetical protein